MPRLFVAVDLPAEVKSALSELRDAWQKKIPTARWSKPENMHLTLRFIGANVPAEKVEPIKSALAGIRADRFNLSLARLGRFPPSEKKAPRVLWAGIMRNDGLDALHAAVETALNSAGFAPENRSFNPHITLARLKTHKPTPEADSFLRAGSDFKTDAFRVDEFLLYESQLTPQGPRYAHIGHYPLL